MGRGLDRRDGFQHMRPVFAGFERRLRRRLNRSGIGRGRHCIHDPASPLSGLRAYRRHGRFKKVVLGDPIDHAERERLARLDPPSAADQRNRLRHSGQTRQTLRAARAGNEAERGFGQTHDRAGRRDALVAAECQLIAAAKRGAVKRRDDRLGTLLDGGDHGGKLRLLDRLVEFP